MKDFAEKFTFGFIMAQLFPGLVAILSCTLAFSSVGRKEASLLAAIGSVINLWTKTTTTSLTLLFLSICAGMAIHGLHWAVMGFMERYDPVLKKCVLFLFRKSSVKAVAIEENVPSISHERMEQFHNIQDFYLHFAQFYAHTSYSLLTFFLSLIVFTGFSEFTPKRVLLIVLGCRNRIFLRSQQREWI